MSNFNKNLDELIPLYGKKCNITRHLKKNYRENIHYITEKDNLTSLDNKYHGGQNKITFMLTESAFEILHLFTFQTPIFI